MVAYRPGDSSLCKLRGRRLRYAGIRCINEASGVLEEAVTIWASAWVFDPRHPARPTGSTSGSSAREARTYRSRPTSVVFRVCRRAQVVSPPMRPEPGDEARGLGDGAQPAAGRCLDYCCRTALARYSACAEKAPAVSSTSARAMPACLAAASHPSTAVATSSTTSFPRSSVNP